VFVAVSHFHPCLIFVDIAGAYSSGEPYGTPPNGKTSSLTHKYENAVEVHTLAHNLAYHDMELIRIVNGFKSTRPNVKKQNVQGQMLENIFFVKR
jgi:hypothetical protein